MRVVKTIFISLVLIFASLLWITRPEDFPSQSASALSENSHWYYLMHLCIIFTFVSDWITHPKRWLNLLVAVGGCFIMYFDMFTYPVEHNWATGFTMAAAVASLIVYAPTAQERIYIIVCCVIGAIMFPLGLFTNVSLFWTEVFAEACIGVGMARRFWVEDYE